MSNPPAEPDLYGMGPDGRPVLYGRRCAGCGYVSFPRQSYGCERCGSPDPAEPVELAAAGVVQAATTVHAHHDPKVPTPFTIAAIRLDDGPVLRVRHLGTPAVGDRARGTLVPVSAPGAGGSGGAGTSGSGAGRDGTASDADGPADAPVPVELRFESES